MVENSSMRGEGVENSWKFNSRVGVEEILFDTLKLNTKKLSVVGFYDFLKTTNF